ncbi:IclR family transcriptional regulator [Halomicrobium katesii]|uniref:IclR family transcriptional regulator n=1 Tax=Halomicrobium katesii TaxID=437163 RepID=UPI0003784662|nr:IclR family transcriptional regulator [Halomicrobium katesii]
MPQQNNSGEIQSVQTAFQILEELRRRNEASLMELTDAFSLSKSSIHNYLSTLEGDGYVVKDGSTYRLSLKHLALGGKARRREQIYDIARDEVTDLAEETGEMANLLVEENGKGIYIHRDHGADAVKTDSYVGQRVNLHSTALGNAILAHLPEERVDEIIERHGLPEMTENTITERDELFERLKRVRTEGVAFDDEARVKGLRCVAVPIVNNDDVVEGAISVSGPTSRLQGDRFRSELPAKLKSVANVIELNITYT